MIYWRIFLVFVFMIFSGCASLSITPKVEVQYNNGIAIYQSEKPQSKVQFELAQSRIKGIDSAPLLIYITAQNMSDGVASFSSKNVIARQGESVLYPLGFDRLKRYPNDISDILFLYGKEIDRSGMPNDDWLLYPTFVPFIPMSVYMYPFGFYDYSFARARMQSAYQAELQKRVRRLLIANYLRENTLKKDDVAGGFILIESKNIIKGELLIVVGIGDESHVFALEVGDRTK